MNHSGQIDKARPEHWETVWQGAEMPPPLIVDSPSIRHYPDRAFDALFSGVFAQWPPPEDATLIELGCGRSIWLPYFATRFGLKVAGLDYSEAGCDQARALLARDGLDGDIRHGDIFDPPGDMRERYDLVVSFGLVEHFSDTADCLRNCAAFLKPGGLMVTTVPNMFGVNGLLTRLINRPVYDMHVPLDADMLRAAHADAGLQVLAARYLMPINLSVAYPPSDFPYLAKKAINGSLSIVSWAIWMLDRRGLDVPVRPGLSPYVVCVARKPA